MKKSLIALAVAAALGTSAVAQADTILYGSARVSVDWANPDIDNRFATFFNLGSNKDYWEVVNNSSRLGVKGSEDLGAGLSAIYQYEFGIDVTGNTNYFNSNRPRWAGLKGNFGSVTLGTQWTPYYNVIGLTDQFNAGKSFDSYFLRGTAYDGIPLLYRKGRAELRRGNSIIYTTPDFSGLSGQLMLVMDGRTPGGARAIDVYEANIKYENGPYFAGATFLDIERDDTFLGGTPQQIRVGKDDQQYGVALGYKPQQWGVLLSWQHYDPEEKFDPFFRPGAPVTSANFVPGQADVDDYTVAGYFAFGNNLARATLSYVDVDDFDGDIWILELGLQHNFSKRTRLWAEYFYFDQELEDVNEFQQANVSIDDSQRHAVSVGIRHDF